MLNINLKIIFLFLFCLILMPLTVKADYSGMNIAPDSEGDLIAFELLAYNSYVLADDYFYISGWEWSADNTSITFSEAYMSTGEAIENLTIESDVNVTFSMVSNRQITYSIPNNGTQIFSGVLEPVSVTVDGSLTDNYTYTEATQNLIVNGALSTVDIVFTAGITVYDVIPIIIVFGLLGLAVALIYAVRHKRGDD
jgi:hypothetical protein